MKSHSNQQVVVKSEARTKKERGASLVEYSLLVALLSCVVLTSVRVVGATVNESVMNTTEALTGSGGIEAD